MFVLLSSFLKIWESKSLSKKPNSKSLAKIWLQWYQIVPIFATPFSTVFVLFAWFVLVVNTTILFIRSSCLHPQINISKYTSNTHYFYFMNIPYCNELYLTNSFPFMSFSFFQFRFSSHSFSYTDIFIHNFNVTMDVFFSSCPSSSFLS